MGRGFWAGLVVAVGLFGGLWWLLRADEVGRQIERNSKPRRLISVEEEEAMLETLRKGAPPIDPDGPHPVAVTQERVHKFGSTAMLDERTHVFKIKNEGDVPLKLVPGRVSSEYVSGKVLKTELAKGESTDVEVTWRAEQLTIKQYDESFNVYTNDPKNRDIRFAVMGTIALRVVLDPGPRWRMGDISGTEPVSMDGFIGTPFFEEFKIHGIVTSSPLIKVTHEPATAEYLAKRQCKSGYFLKAELTPTFPPGDFEGLIKIQTDIDQGPQTPGLNIVVRLYAWRASAVRFLPATNNARFMIDSHTLLLGRFPAAEGFSCVVPFLVTQEKDAPVLELTNVDAKDSNLKVELQPAAEAESSESFRRYELKFSVPAGEPVANHIETDPVVVRLTANHPDMKDMEIKVVYVSQ